MVFCAHIGTVLLHYYGFITQNSTARNAIPLSIHIILLFIIVIVYF